MATLALGLVGTAIGAGIGGGITVLGATLTAASIGGMIGSTIGGYIDSMIIASLTPAIRNEGPRLQEITVMQSTEGAVVGRLHGIMRVGGNLIWSARFKETKTTESEEVGGKGGGGGQTVETTTYTYSCSFAVAFGEGSERTDLGRLWMDGKEVDLSVVSSTFYRGTSTQSPDSVIQAVEGAGKTPGFRDTCYIVFEDFELGEYSNRIPQVTAEIISPLETSDPDDISNIGRSFCLIPGSGEFVYGTDIYTVQNGSNGLYTGGQFTNLLGGTIDLPSASGDNIPASYMNMHNQRGVSDFVRSMEQLELFQPNLDAIVLVVGWFGDDLRIGNCELRPYVEFKDRNGVVTPREWNVTGLTRSHADIPEVGRDADGNPIYGGTPSDDVVVEAIQWLKARGHRVVFYPFIFMHIESGNTLPDPYSDNAADTGQPVFPWRGRITCSPAAGYAGTVDKTAAAATQVSNFFGSAAPGDFVTGGTVAGVSHTNCSAGGNPENGYQVTFAGTPLPSNGVGETVKITLADGITEYLVNIAHVIRNNEGGTVTWYINSAVSWSSQTVTIGGGAAGLQYTGPAEWSMRRMILHYANLCDIAGGVDAFIIGTEMVGTTTIRSSASAYPAVTEFQNLAGDVRTVVGAGTKISYAADWSEYHSHRPSDGTGDVFFHLDPLWADSDIDFIGIDNYLPLSDWRDGSSHLDYDADAGIVTPHNITYLKSNIEGGEYYDWYYASSADRDSQTRTPITDGAYSKDWVFRQKDIRNWWSNAHYNRPGGVESGSPTAYTASTKPIWFTEFGCPCVDKGTNQPNVFYDPKSSESFFPYYSSGLQDEYISRVYAEAMLTYWRDNSPVGMLDIDNMFIWCWDARPYPDYPSRLDVWSDGDLWRYGHWMTGRIAYPALPRLIESLCEEVGVTDIDVTQLNGTQGLVKGIYTDTITSNRDVISSLMSGFQFDAFESEGKIKFALKQSTSLTALTTDQFVSSDRDPNGFTITRAQDTELPKRVVVDFIDAFNDYEISSLDAKRHQTTNVETASVRLPMSLAPDYVRGLADSMLHQAWVARESGTVNLPPSLFKLDPADGITFPIGNSGRVGQARIQSIENGEFREVSFQAFDLSLYSLPVYPAQTKAGILTQVPGFPVLYALDIPLYSGDEPSHWSPRLAAFANPWPGSVAVYKDEDPDLTAEDWELKRTLNLENVIGTLVNDVGTGATGVWLRNQTITVKLLGGTLPSATSDLKVLNGENVCAMRNDSGHWEIFQYKTATLDGNGDYVLSDLIRGQLGTEWVMNEDAFSAENPFVLLENQFSINPSSAPYFPLTAGDRDSLQSMRYGSAYKSIDDDNAYLETNFFHEAMAKKPYSPTQLKAKWTLSVNNDIELSWMRRTRFDGDPWELASVPLNEEVEEYELEILNGSTVVREVTGLTSPAYTYTDAMQVADFGSAQTTSIKIRVYQMSTAVGRGIPAEETLNR